MAENDYSTQIGARFKEIVDLIEAQRRRVDAAVVQLRAGPAAPEPPDDGSLGVARAVERLAELPVKINQQRLHLRIAESDVAHNDTTAGYTAGYVEHARKKLADLKAEKERAVLDLAAQLAAWRKAP